MRAMNVARSELDMTDLQYTVLEPLRGGRLFRGVAESPDGHKRDVTIERVLPSMTRNLTFLEMFLADLRSSPLLKHPNIVEVLDITRTPDDAFFVVAEYMEGCDLKSLVARSERIALQHAVYIAIECCKALAYAHEREVIHRDLSPRAILLSIKGEVKIADFGLAMATTQIESSDPGIVKGRFSYLSPEAADGSEFDHRHDVFAAGVVLWELLAGRRLFLGGTDYETVMLVRGARVDRIDGLDSELHAILGKALVSDPSARYESARDFGDALARYAHAGHVAPSPEELAKLVREAHLASMRDLAVKPIEPRSLVEIQADVERMTSILDGNGGSGRWN